MKFSIKTILNGIVVLEHVDYLTTKWDVEAQEMVNEIDDTIGVFILNPRTAHHLKGVRYMYALCPCASDVIIPINGVINESLNQCFTYQGEEYESRLFEADSITDLKNKVKSCYSKDGVTNPIVLGRLNSEGFKKYFDSYVNSDPKNICDYEVSKELFADSISVDEEVNN